MALNILKFLLILLEVLLLFNLLIIVHELGHFLAAKWRGLVVEKFAIWFGKPIWKKTIGGVEYSLGSIPAGGFVALPQLAPMDIIEGETHTDRARLPRASVMDKIIVAIAGPIFSLGLAFTFAVIVSVIGRPVSEAEMTTTVGYVEPDGPAAKAGIQPGDRILAVDSHAVTQFAGMGNVRGSITWNIARSQTPTIPIVIERDGQQKTLEVTPVIPPREGWGRKNLPQIGIIPVQTPLIAKTIKNSPAAEAGLKAGDFVIAADGQKLLSLIALSDIIDKKQPGESVTLTIQRGDKTSDVRLTPRVIAAEDNPQDKKLRVGILWDIEGKNVIIHPNPFHLIADSLRTMWATISAVTSVKSGIKAQHLSGPVGIMHVYYILFQKPDSWRLVIWFSVILNVNLAVLNMLPIPVLDGGHILLAIIEGVSRRTINIRILEIVQSACAVVIIGFVLYVTFFDFMDLNLPWKRHGALPSQVETSSSPAPK